QRYVTYGFRAANGLLYIGACSMDEPSLGPAVGSTVPVRYLASNPGHNYLVGVNPPSLLEAIKVLAGLLLFAFAAWLFRRT
ncbi:MAG: hypothetical protein NTV46_22275, partial [Verrucomicrobia bacterium]|nr:hypothetical protein [Verrucomicrobiota bacterium]